MPKVERKQTLRSILQGMGENSTIHGIPRIASARHPSFRIIWLCLFLGVTGFLIFQLQKLFTAYYSWPVKTSVSLAFSKLQFPAVSFCNMNPIKKSKLGSASNELQGLFNPRLVHKKRKKRSAPGDSQSATSDDQPYQDIMPYIDYNVDITPTPTQSIETMMQTSTVLTSAVETSYPSDIATSSEDLANCVGSDGLSTNNCGSGENDDSNSYVSSSYSNWWDWYRDSPSESSYSSSYYGSSGYYSSGYSSSYDYYDDDWLAPKDKWQDRVEKFLNAFQNESKASRYDMGHSLDDMLISCSFATKVCYPSNFTKFQTSEYGNCYTLESDKFTTRRTGPLYGLWLTINLETQEYMTNFADAYGIKMIIHEPGTFPFPAEEGITLNPNYETTIGLRMIDISRLGPPHGECDAGTIFENTFGVKYTVPACVKLCKQRKVLDECKCIPTDVDIDIDLEKKHNKKRTRFCDLEDTEDFMCIEHVNTDFAAGLLDCFCNNPCKEIVYEKTLSGRHWPNEDYLRYSLIHDLCKKNLSYNSIVCTNYTQNATSFILDKFKDNFLRVMIYYEDLNYEMIKEDPLYDSFQFISDIGGTLGLCIGGSILSIFEFVQLLMEIIHFFRTKWIHKHSQVSGSMQELNIGISKPVKIQNAQSDGLFHPNYVISPSEKGIIE